LNAGAASLDPESAVGFRSVVRHLRRELMSGDATWQARCLGLKYLQQAVAIRFRLPGATLSPLAFATFTSSSALLASAQASAAALQLPAVNTSLSAAQAAELRLQLSACQVVFLSCLQDTMQVVLQTCQLLAWVAPLMSASLSDSHENFSLPAAVSASSPSKPSAVGQAAVEEWCDPLLPALLQQGAAVATRPQLKAAVQATLRALWGSSASGAWSPAAAQTVLRTLGETGSSGSSSSSGGKNEGARLMAMDLTSEYLTCPRIQQTLSSNDQQSNATFKRVVEALAPVLSQSIQDANEVRIRL
jgi:hypothetical protein